MQFYELQLFPKRSLHLGGFVNVQNISELREKLNAKKLQFAVLNPGLVFEQQYRALCSFLFFKVSHYISSML
jgi:hypothetical protein